MSKSNNNTGKPWSNSDVKHLKELIKGNTPTRLIGLKLDRTESAIYSKASALGISLKPTNQSPYNRRKKSTWECLLLSHKEIGLLLSSDDYNLLRLYQVYQEPWELALSV